MVEWNGGIANSAKMRYKIIIFGFQMMPVTSPMVMSALIWLATAYLKTITVKKQHLCVINSGSYIYVYVYVAQYVQ